MTQSERDQPINPSVLKTLAALQREGRPDILSTLINLFLDNARTLLQELERAASDADLKLLGQASHALGSASANIGASSLAELCKDLERQARAGTVPDPVARVAAIVAEYRRAEAALLAHLGRAAGSTMGMSA